MAETNSYMLLLKELDNIAFVVNQMLYGAARRGVGAKKFGTHQLKFLTTPLALYGVLLLVLAIIPTSTLLFGTVHLFF